MQVGGLFCRSLDLQVIQQLVFLFCDLVISMVACSHDYGGYVTSGQRFSDTVITKSPNVAFKL